MNHGQSIDPGFFFVHLLQVNPVWLVDARLTYLM